LGRSQSAKDESDNAAACDQPQDQKTGPRPALRECREKASQKFPVTSVPFRGVTNKPARVSQTTLWSLLGLDNATPDSDHRRVGSVGRTELGKNILNATFDAIFCNRKLLGDLFVRVSGRDQPQHIDFSWG
jgi:hypothetical protein